MKSQGFLKYLGAVLLVAAGVSVASAERRDGAVLVGIDGTCHYTPLVAQRYEVAIIAECGSFCDAIKADDPSTLVFVYKSGTDNYTNPASASSGPFTGSRAHAWMRDECISRGLSPEILYLHFYDNTTVSGLNIPGTYSYTLTDADSVSRVPTYHTYYVSNGQGRIVFNFANPTAREIYIDYLKQAFTNPNAGNNWTQTSYFDGIYLDNWLNDYLSPSMGKFYDVPVGGSLVEEPTHSKVNSPTAYTWYTNVMHTFALELRRELANAASWSPDGKRKLLALNISNSWASAFADTAQGGADYLLLEFAYTPLRNYEYSFADSYTRDSLCATNDIALMYCGLLQATASSGAGTLSYPEQYMGALAWYYVTTSPISTFTVMNGGSFWINPDPTEWDTLTWRGCMDVDIGSPLGGYSVFSSGNDPTGQQYKVFTRNYQNAKVFVRPRYQWNDNFTPSTAVTIAPGGTYRELNTDGTLGPPQSSFSLKNACGLILMNEGTSGLTPPANSSPVNGSTTSDNTPTLTVNNGYDPQSRTLEYQFQFDGNGDWTGGDLISSSAGQITVPNGSQHAWTVPTSVADGTYFWRCRIVTTSGAYEASSWTSPWTVTVNTSPTNNCPGAPIAQSPSNSAIGQSLAPTLVVGNATDADGDPLTYRFEVHSNASMTSLVANASGVVEGGSTTQWTVTTTLSSSTQYWWRVRANDGQCDGGWSTVFNFTTTGAGNSCPGPPTVQTPSNGATGQSLTPVLVVGNATDADGDPLTYRFEVYSNAAMTNLVASASGIAEGGSTTQWTVSPSLLNTTLYWWRARANDGQCDGGWSTTSTFTTFSSGNYCPTPAYPNAPPNAATGVSISPTLTVNNATDANGDALFYGFEVYSDASLTNLVASSGWVGEGGGTTTSWTVSPTLGAGATYWWRCRAYDGQCISGYGSTRSFTTASGTNNCPSVPSLASPSNGAGGQSPAPSLSIWNATDPDGDPLTYRFEVSSNSAMTNLVVASPWIGQGAGANTVWTVSPPLNGGAQYWWRVQSNDGQCVSGYSSVRNFTTSSANFCPTPPLAAAPIDGAGNQSRNPGLTVFNAADPNGDPLTYEFDVYADAALTNLVTSAAGIPEQAALTTWQVNVTLAYQTTYWWRVRASDGACNGGYCPVRSFTVVPPPNQPPPPPIPLGSPEGDTATLPIVQIQNAVDPNGDTVKYDFVMFCFDGTCDSAVDVPQTTGLYTFWMPDTILEKNQDFWWVCRSNDGQAVSDWTAPDTFYYTNIPPNMPGPASPLTGDTISGSPFPVTIANATDIDGDPTRTYEFEVYNSEQLTSRVALGQFVPEGNSLTSWLADFPYTNGWTYWWRARCHDGTEFSPWIPAQGVTLFQLVVGIEEGHPEPTAPINGASVRGRRPVLVARNTTGDATSYCEFFVANDGNFDDIIVRSPEVAFDGTGLASWQCSKKLTRNHNYFWRVRYSGDDSPSATESESGARGGQFSHTETFFVEQGVIAAPNPFDPAAGDESIVFQNLPEDAEIAIFTVAGLPVIHIDPAGRSEFEWNVTNGRGEAVAPGVYLYAVRSSDENKEGRLVINR